MDRAALILSLLLSACLGEVEFDLPEQNPLPAPGQDTVAIPGTPEQIVSRSPEDDEEGLFISPELVEAEVGEDLFLDVTLRDPSVGTIVVDSVPEHADWTPITAGWRVHWRPTIGEVGEHTLTFILVVGDDGDVVLARREVGVIVLGTLPLVEYGF